MPATIPRWKTPRWVAQLQDQLLDVGLIGVDGRVRHPDEVTEHVAIRADEDPHAGRVVQLDALAEVIEKAEGEPLRHVRQGAQHLVRLGDLVGKAGSTQVMVSPCSMKACRRGIWMAATSASSCRSEWDRGSGGDKATARQIYFGQYDGKINHSLFRLLWQD
jgi:hypothetical protein